MDNDINHFIWLLEFKEVTHLKCLAQCLAHGICPKVFDDTKTVLESSRSDFSVFKCTHAFLSITMYLIFKVIFIWQWTDNKHPVDNQKLVIFILNLWYLQKSRARSFQDQTLSVSLNKIRGSCLGKQPTKD